MVCQFALPFVFFSLSVIQAKGWRASYIYTGAIEITLGTIGFFVMSEPER
jgi:hypothetical protein